MQPDSLSAECVAISQGLRLSSLLPSFFRVLSEAEGSPPEVIDNVRAFLNRLPCRAPEPRLPPPSPQCPLRAQYEVGNPVHNPISEVVGSSLSAAPLSFGTPPSRKYSSRMLSTPAEAYLPNVSPGQLNCLHPVALIFRTPSGNSELASYPLLRDAKKQWADWASANHRLLLNYDITTVPWEQATAYLRGELVDRYTGFMRVIVPFQLGEDAGFTALGLLGIVICDPVSLSYNLHTSVCSQYQYDLLKKLVYSGSWRPGAGNSLSFSLAPTDQELGVLLRNWSSVYDVLKDLLHMLKTSAEANTVSGTPDFIQLDAAQVGYHRPGRATAAPCSGAGPSVAANAPAVNRATPKKAVKKQPPKTGPASSPSAPPDSQNNGQVTTPNTPVKPISPAQETVRAFIAQTITRTAESLRLSQLPQSILTGQYPYAGETICVVPVEAPPPVVEVAATQTRPIRRPGRPSRFANGSRSPEVSPDGRVHYTS